MLDIKKNLLRKTQNYVILVSFQRGTEIMKGGHTMINVRTIRKLADNDGLTLKKGKKIAYKTGWQVADHGVDGTIEVGALTGSSRTRRYAHLRYDITIHYADGSTRTDNVDLLDALETNDEWWGEFVDRHRQGGVVLTMRYLPNFPQAWSVTGVRAG